VAVANADVLGEVLGMDLELAEAEHKVGGFALDLIGRDLSTGEQIIVEQRTAAAAAASCQVSTSRNTSPRRRSARAA
jgi:hypothetical protein